MTGASGVVLSDEEREVLERWARRPTQRAGAGVSLPDRAGGRGGRLEHARSPSELGCNPLDGRASGAARFAERGLDGLQDEPRPGKPRTISDEEVERVIVKTLEEQPRMRRTGRHGRWRPRPGCRRSAVSRIWRAFGLKPHQTESFKLSPDPQFIDKVQRHRRALPEPAGGGGRVVCRREDADPGAGPHSADPASDAGP